MYNVTLYIYKYQCRILHIFQGHYTTITSCYYALVHFKCAVFVPKVVRVEPISYSSYFDVYLRMPYTYIKYDTFGS